MSMPDAAAVLHLNVTRHTFFFLGSICLLYHKQTSMRAGMFTWLTAVASTQCSAERAPTQD